tara:strand:+ start:34414 stop:36369 length:1956 start_codon:yes stop_codon:yes gene_type:complete
MQFRYPEVFYFLFVLIIPIIVHLFHLQKFQKIAFTNVAFLKKISLETRKSSKLKKWLLLTSRLLTFLAILFTFSQPYFSNTKAGDINHNIIYLDNSLSLNTNSSNGDQLKIAAQKIIEHASISDEFSLITNNTFYPDINKNELDNYLKKIEFSSSRSNLAQKIIEIKTKNNHKTNTLYKSILISDFQYYDNNKNKKFTNVNTPISLVKINSNQKDNISIDSIYVSSNTAQEILISVSIKNQGEEKNNIPIALYNSSQLINKRSFSIEKNKTKNIEFSIPKTTKFLGKIEITFNDIFLFDNLFYFSINSRKKTKVLSIGKASKSFPRIFTNEGFDFKNSSLQNINYNSIPEKQLIILNELETIPNVLQNTLLQFAKNGGHLLIIPNQKIETASYNLFFSKINKGSITGIRKDSLKITDINYQHQIFTDVFSKQVDNFQYPSVTRSYQSTFNGDKVISYENKSAFLLEVSNPYSKIYWFSSPIDIASTNFSNSPLIVPTLYNIGQQSLKITKPYYTLQENNIIEIDKKIGKDEILTISNDTDSFIPLQQSYTNKVKLTTNTQPKNPGFYEVMLKKDTLETIAYNISSKESILSFYDLKALEKSNENFEIYDSIEGLFSEINQKNEVQWLWKLFLTIAIVSLLLEILILKFFRT